MVAISIKCSTVVEYYSLYAEAIKRVECMSCCSLIFVHIMLLLYHVRAPVAQIFMLLVHVYVYATKHSEFEKEVNPWAIGKACGI